MKLVVNARVAEAVAVVTWRQSWEMAQWCELVARPSFAGDDDDDDDDGDSNDDDDIDEDSLHLCMRKRMCTRCARVRLRTRAWVHVCARAETHKRRRKMHDQFWLRAKTNVVMIV